MWRQGQFPDRLATFFVHQHQHSNLGKGVIIPKRDYLWNLISDYVFPSTDKTDYRTLVCDQCGDKLRLDENYRPEEDQDVRWYPYLTGKPYLIEGWSGLGLLLVYRRRIIV